MLQRPHLPTLGTTLIILVGAFLVYHFFINKRG